MANTLRRSRGAVEPAEVGASGNELKLWRGAVEPNYVPPPPGVPGGSGRTGPGLTFGKFGRMGA